jgi:hypothetical protein
MGALKTATNLAISTAPDRNEKACVCRDSTEQMRIALARELWEVVNMAFKSD